MALKELKKKVANKIGDVLSFPARSYYEAKGKKADNISKIVREVREMRGVPDKGDHTDPLFRKRMIVKNLHYKAKK